MTINLITGTAEDDSLQATPRRDMIDVLAGDDWVVLAGGHDTVLGGDGDDTVFGYFGGDVLHGGAGNDSLVAASSAESDPSRLVGGEGNDVIFISPAGSTARGGDGDDHISLLVGSTLTSVRGGLGSDLLSVSALGGDFTDETDFLVRATGPRATVLADGGQVLSLAGFERLDVTLRGGDDTVVGTTLDDRFDLWDGANQARAGSGDDHVAYRQGSRNILSGGEGEDSLWVGPWYDSPDVLLIVSGDRATDGNLSRISGFEHYQVYGGLGSDVAQLGAGSDLFSGGDGADMARGMDGADQLSGGKGRDSLDGGSGRDRLQGGEGGDVLTRGEGADRFVFVALDGKPDRITDFTSGLDQIAVNNLALGRVLPRGILDAAGLQIGTAQGDGPQFVLRASDHGAWQEVVFDANGQAEGGEISVALLSATASLLPSDILIL